MLEMILSYLPARNIFGTQRVAKKWKHAVETSPKLQKKLFLRLDNKYPNALIVTNNQGRPFQSRAHFNDAIRFGTELQLRSVGLEALGQLEGRPFSGLFVAPNPRFDVVF